jgi:ribosomal protein S18 acetylase RimI-like enzyme
LIREFKLDDINQLNEIIIKGDNIIDDIDIIRDIQSQAKKLLVYDENGIKGFVYISLRNEEENEWNIQLYVDFKERRKGIGTALYKEVLKYLDQEKPLILVTEFRVDINDSTHFYERLGYEKWFRCPNLVYKETSIKDVNIDFITYEDKYYDQYTECRQECFYELRKTYDFKPYLIPKSEEDRERFLSDKDSIYLTLDNESLVACVTVKKGCIDNIMVSPTYQGKGYGKKVTQFAINKALSEGVQPIYLYYIEGNKKAVNLYKALGFETLQIIDVYRKFVNY